MKWTVMLGRPMVDGTCRWEVGEFVKKMDEFCRLDERVFDYIEMPIQRYPANVARNCIVKKAQEFADPKVDILGMIDADMLIPPEFFPFAFEFLIKHQGPACIGVPYCTGGEKEGLTVSEWFSPRSSDSAPGVEVRAVDRLDAARRTGVEEIANMGCGCVFYTMSCFEKITKPYFNYSYNADCTAVIETEDCWCHRKLSFAKVPVYVAWDYFSQHRKDMWIPKPVRILTDNVDEMIRLNAVAEDRLKQRNAALEPTKHTKTPELVHPNGE
jgi:hypothetical protein